MNKNPRFAQLRIKDICIELLKSMISLGAANSILSNVDFIIFQRIRTMIAFVRRPNIPPPVIQTLTVHRSRRIATPDSVLTVTIQNCIYRGSERRHQLDTIYNQLDQTGLLSLLLGQRQQPPMYSEDDTDYTKEKIIMKPRILSLLRLLTAYNRRLISQFQKMIFSFTTMTH
jgi:hypothetical protein